jgi:hypothetical protein
MPYFLALVAALMLFTADRFPSAADAFATCTVTHSASTCNHSLNR